MGVIKRNGKIQQFSAAKITNAIKRANAETDEVMDQQQVKEFVVEFKSEENYPIDYIQDKVEAFLMGAGYVETAKHFIIYREKHAQLRDWTKKKIDFINKYKQSSNNANSTIDDNANVTSKNISCLNSEIHKEDNIQISRRMIMDKLSQLYPDFDSKQYEDDLTNHIIYKHDESSFSGAIAPYCCSISMYPFLIDGIRKLGGLSAMPKNLDSFCGIYINLIFATSAQFAGAIATSEFLMYFDYFARQEFGQDYTARLGDFVTTGPKLRKLRELTSLTVQSLAEVKAIAETPKPYICTSAKMREAIEIASDLLDVENPDEKLSDSSRTILGKINQSLQQVIYSINQPAASRGSQSAFTNFSLFDKGYFQSMFALFGFPDGSKPVWETLNWLQQHFLHWFNQERLKCILTFPVVSYAVLYIDGKFQDEDTFKFICQEYAEGNSFFLYISDTADSLASCCRLKNKVQTKEFTFTNGLVGIMTGSKSVITLNLNRIIQDYVRSCSSTKKPLEVFNTTVDDASAGIMSFESYLIKILGRVYKYQTAYNELLWDMYSADLLPAYKAGFIDLNKQYLTIGLNGLTAAADYLKIAVSPNETYSKFCQRIFSCIKEQNEKHLSDKTKFNTELVPGESLGLKNYNWDKADGYVVPKDINLYTSYVFKPYDSKSILDNIILHGRDYIGDYLDGGAAAHLNLSEHLTEPQYEKLLVFAAENGTSYITFNIPNSECCDCQYITKVPITKCPVCGSERIDLYDRPIGYLTKIKSWSDGRQKEQKKRIYF